MPTVDRYWWAETLFALVLAAGAIVAAVLPVLTVLPLKTFGEDISGNLLAVLATGLLLLLTALVLAFMSVRARYRARMRRSVFRGMQDAIPMSRLTVHPEAAPDVATEPLVLEWIVSARTKLARGQLLVLHGLLLLATLVLSEAYLALVLREEHPTGPSDVPRILTIAGMVLVAVLTVVLLGIIGRALPTLFGRPFGITASDGGIMAKTMFGSNRRLRWEDMRLLEVATSRTPGGRQFFLQGGRVTISWSNVEANSRDFRPHGMTAEEMTVRVQAMLDLINARTGLAPRTFTKTLRAADTAASPVDSRVMTFLALLVLATFTCGVAVGAVVVPLTTLHALNLDVASSLAIVALVLMAVAFRRLMLRPTRDKQPDVLQSSTPLSLGDSDYELAYGFPPSRRLAFTTLGAVLLVNLAPLLLVWLPIMLYSLLPRATRQYTPSALSAALAYIVGIYGGTGLALLRSAVRNGNIRVHAGAKALTDIVGKQSHSLPWGTIERVEEHRRNGRALSYEAIGEGGEIKIIRMAEPSRLRQLLPTGNTLPIAPDELTRFVAQRSGKPIDVR
jgi:hypothetical protein